MPRPQSDHGPHPVRHSGLERLGLLSGVFCLCTKQAARVTIDKIGATRCQILRLKCTKFDFRLGSAPDPAGGSYSAPQTLLLYLRGLLLRGERGRREGKGRGRKGGESSPIWGVWICQCACMCMCVVLDLLCRLSGARLTVVIHPAYTAVHFYVDVIMWA